MNNLDTLKNRLSKLGIDVVFVSNFPWVYLWSINGVKVTEKNQSEYGFTVGFLSIRKDRDPFKFVELDVIFKLIRKYC